MYGINYEVVDLKDEFTLLEAACYWVDIPAYPSFGKIPDGKKSEVKLVSATSTTTLFPSNDIGFRKFATMTFMPFCHAACVS